MEKKTPLYQTHVDMGGKIVEFGGFLMPVQYPTGVIAEHMAVREKAGLFDVSHMGELRLKGPDAVANVQKIITADISNMKDGEIKYSMFCNDNGGIIDDFIVYRCAADNYWLVVNAGNREKDAAWVESHLSGDVDYRDEGNDWGQIALQGPSPATFSKSSAMSSTSPPSTTPSSRRAPEPRRAHDPRPRLPDGYTGEYGFEIYCKAEDTVDLWKALLKAGEPEGLILCGLGARDTLRLEASMPLYGHEMNDEITPKMAGLPCKLTGKDFIGRDALVALGAPKMKRIGMKSSAAASCASTATSTRWTEKRSAGHPPARSRPISAAALRWAISPPKISRSASTSTPTCAAAWSSWRSCRCRSTNWSAKYIDIRTTLSNSRRNT